MCLIGEYAVHIYTDEVEIPKSPFVVIIGNQNELSDLYKQFTLEIFDNAGAKQENVERMHAPVVVDMVMQGEPADEASLSNMKESLSVVLYEADTGAPIPGVIELCRQSGGQSSACTFSARLLPRAAGRHVLYVTHHYTPH